ncbi:Serine/threonine-protein kinase Nek2 [Linnemannia zychae]|nr:Serine/threonine-protein kinase Nek2 [Linnemannia zychae]
MLHNVLEMEGYESLESIGSGSFGLIRKVRRKSDGKILARKEIDYRKMTTKEKEQLVAEVNILKDLKHPNIVQFLERIIDREHCFIYILMEYCEGGDLAAVIKRHREMSTYIPEEFVWNIMVQLIMALHECHHGTIINEETQQITPRPILHRDLKPDNVFLDGKHNVKLGDFGLSRSLTNPQKAFAQTYVGTPFYMSPELINEFTYDAKSDIWSLGCVIYEMCALEPPFLADTQAQLSARIKEGRVRSLPSNYTQELDSIVKAMLQVNSRKRPTTKDLLNNPLIKGIQKSLDLTRRNEEMQSQILAQMEKATQIAEQETQCRTHERKLQAWEQALREREVVLNSKVDEYKQAKEAIQRREEAIAQKEEMLQNAEAHLLSLEQKLLREQQLLEERSQNLMEQERASMRNGFTGNGSTEAMIVENKSMSELGNTIIASNPSTAVDINGINGISSKHTRPIGHTTKPTLFSANHKPNLPVSSSHPTSMFSTSMNMTPKGTVDNPSISTDTASTTRPAPRRKTGLNIGRYSLQTGTTSRSKAPGGPGGTTTHTYNIDTQEKNSLFSGAQGSSHLVIPQPRPSSVFASLSSLDITSNSSKQFQGQSYAYHGIAGKESRLSGRPSLTNNAGLEAPKLRAKSKSASTLAATLSSTTLSGTGAGAAISATISPTSANNTSSSNTNSNNPFLVLDSGKNTSTPTTTTTSSAVDQANITFGSNSNATFYFTPAATLTSIKPQDQVSEPSDVQMSETTSESTLNSSPSKTQPPAISNGQVRNYNGAAASSSGSSAAPSTSPTSVATSASQSFSSRRINTSGITASMGHIRFQPQQHPSSGSGSSTAVSINGATTSAIATPSQTTASTSIAGISSNVAMTLGKFHIGSGGGGSSSSSNNVVPTSGGTVPHILGTDRYSRSSTPPSSNLRHHHYQNHHHQQQQPTYIQQQQQQQQQGDDGDLRMEWDGDIPSPFIKKTYNRPLGGGGISSSSTSRNL